MVRDFIEADYLLETPGEIERVAEFMAGEGCRVAFVESREEKAFLDEMARRSATPRLLTRVSGVNINRAFERDRRTLRVMDFGVYLRDTSRP